MNLQGDQIAGLWPLLVYFAAVIALVAAILALSFLLGQRHRERATAEPYESGVASTGTARIRYDIKFYLIAMFFVIFDVEAVFIFAWAVAVREAGWTGFTEILIFVIILAAALVYLWRNGALDWGAKGRRASKAG